MSSASPSLPLSGLAGRQPSYSHTSGASRLSGSLSNAFSRRVSRYDRNLHRSKGAELNLGLYVLVFNEMIHYAEKNVKGIGELETKLNSFGYHVGLRVLELSVIRERTPKREIRLLGVLQYIHTTIWKSLFGKTADSLERSRESDDEYMISDNDPLITRYIQVPREMHNLNCEAFVAGLIQACLSASQFSARVTAHSTGMEGVPYRVTYLMKFDPDVLARDQKEIETNTTKETLRLYNQWLRLQERDYVLKKFSDQKENLDCK